VAAIHADHTEIRHIHVLAILPRQLNRDEFKAAREGATIECLMQRRELDRARERRQERAREEAFLWNFSLL
jgi:hypothetical protein